MKSHVIFLILVGLYFLGDLFQISWINFFNINILQNIKQYSYNEHSKISIVVPLILKLYYVEHIIVGCLQVYTQQQCLSSTCTILRMNSCNG